MTLPYKYSPYLNTVREFVIDLFCGAGGTSTGAHLSGKNIKVTACVNHDLNAIKSHAENHPGTKHLVEDIRNPEVIFFLRLRVNALRKLYPGCKITLWASLECTNFSKAKGGQPRDADSRTLADFLIDNNVYYIWKSGSKLPKRVSREEYYNRDTAGFIIHGDAYVQALDPDYLMIENVVEFMSWGPLDENGKPVSRKEGRDYLRWIKAVQDHGYRFDYRELNSANFGAVQSRTRYFAQFAKGNLPISWPEPTHAKKPIRNDLFGELKKWRPVREVLDLTKEGKSIFDRKKPLVDATLKRIYAGLVKFVAGGNDISRGAGLKHISFSPSKDEKVDFLLKYNSLSKDGKHSPPSIDEPCPVVPAQNRLGKVSATFLQGYYGNGMPHSTDQPCPTISTKDRFGLLSTEFLVNSYSGGGQVSSVEAPCPAVLNVPKSNIINTWIMATSFDNKGRSIDDPSPTVLAGRKHHYLLNPQYNNAGASIEKPSPTVIARQDKAPMGLISCEIGHGFSIPVYDDDSEVMIKIKNFMAVYGIVDIRMRMLDVKELLQIQGFPADYKLVGTLTEQKKFIGNAVEVTTAKALWSAHHEALQRINSNEMSTAS